MRSNMSHLTHSMNQLGLNQSASGNTNRRPLCVPFPAVPVPVRSERGMNSNLGHQHAVHAQLQSTQNHTHHRRQHALPATKRAQHAQHSQQTQLQQMARMRGSSAGSIHSDMRNVNGGNNRAHSHAHSHSQSLGRMHTTTKAKSAPTQFPPPQRAPPPPTKQTVHQTMYYAPQPQPQPQASSQRRHSHQAQSTQQRHGGGVYVPSLRQSTSQPLLRTHTHAHRKTAQQTTVTTQQHPQQHQPQPQQQPKKRKRNQSATPRGMGPTTQSASTVCLKKYRIEDESFRVWSYYKPTSSKLLGRGGYGVVMEAIDTRNGRAVAIKKMKNVFAHLNTAKCSLRELTLLMHFSHPNVMSATDCMLPGRGEVATFQQVYYVMPKMQSTLKTVCCASDIAISVNHRCFILFQILRGIDYVHACDVIHRDLKPENILIDSDCSIKITDFGMARGLRDEPESGDEEVALSEYVTTRWYRAPEIMLSSRKYSCAIDVWSMACIHLELLLRKPMFAGQHHLEQLELIFDAVGTPEHDEAAEWILQADALRWVRSLPAKGRQPLLSLSRKHWQNRHELDLLHRMLELNPRKRICVRQALQHRFMDKIPTKIKQREGFQKALRFDRHQTFERKLTKLSSCRQVMLDTLQQLHQRASAGQ